MTIAAIPAHGMKKARFQVARAPGQPVSDEELIEDLRRVATQPGTSSVTQHVYGQHGTFNVSTVIRHFGSWNRALRAANLSLANEFYSDEQLFENLLTLWEHYGRQPRRRELEQPPSVISQCPYSRRFGGWTRALSAFVDYANATEREAPEVKLDNDFPSRRKTARSPSLRLRWTVLKRDRFRCRKCGGSPADGTRVSLHVDHVVPYSKGGHTELDNLQTLCSLCNLGKSNELPEE